MSQKSIIISVSLIFILVIVVNASACQQGYFQKETFCESCKKITNAAKNQMLINSCKCTSNYQWSTTQKLCQPTTNLKIDTSADETKIIQNQSNNYLQQKRSLVAVLCDYTKGFILFKKADSSQICLHCNTFQFSDGTALSSSACSCISPASWQKINGLWVCGCLSDINAVYIKGNQCSYCSGLANGSGLQDCRFCKNVYANGALGCYSCASVDGSKGTVNSGLCTCNTGLFFDYYSGKCLCDWSNQKYYQNGIICKACSSLSNAVSKADCNSCSGTFFYLNGSVCVQSTTIPNYNYTASSCSLGYKLSVDIFANSVVGCVCGRSGYYKNGTTCQSCAVLPSGTSINGCNSCSFAQGFSLSNGQCIYCKALSNSYGVTMIGCNCEPTYYFNLLSGQCQCDASKGYIATTTGSCFNCSSDVNSLSLASQGKCICKKGFIWGNQICSCSQANGGYKSSNDCISCSDMVGSSGKVLATGCECIAGYLWSSQNLKCVCDYQQGFSLMNDICYNCLVFVGSDGTASASGCNCAKSYVFNVDTMTCQCGNQLYFYSSGSCNACNSANLPYAVTTTQCQDCLIDKGFFTDQDNCIYCQGLYQTDSVATTSGCNCLVDSYIWNRQYLGCVCDFEKGYYDQYTNGKKVCSFCTENNCKYCLNADGFWLDPTNKVCTKCNGIAQATGVATNAGCKCNTGYYFNTQTYPFSCTCSFKNGGFINNSNCNICLTGNVELISGCSACSNAKYFFLSGNGTCIYCKSLLNNDNAVIPTIRGCACKTGFKWNLSTFSCIQNSVITCTGGKILDSLTNTCYCPYSTIANGSICVCDQISGFATLADGSCILCSTITDATGSVTNKSCNCKYNLNWQSSLQLCGCPATSVHLSDFGCIDCTAIANSNKIVSGNDKLKCSCFNNQQFVIDYIGLTGSCSCPPPYAPIANNACECQVNSLQLPNGLCFACNIVNGVGSVHPQNTSACSCVDTFKFLWDDATSTGSCVCPQNYAQSASGCIACSSILNSIGTVNPNDITQCLCLNNEIFGYDDQGTGFCSCPAPYYPISSQIGCQCNTSISIKTAAGCFSCNILNGNGFINMDNSSECVCIDDFVFFWDKTLEIGQCTCPKTSIPNGNNGCYDCSQVNNSTGFVNLDNIYQCGCTGVLLFHWNYNSVSNTYWGECICPEPYKWDDLRDNCICDPLISFAISNGQCFSCNIPSSDGLVSTANAHACNCYSNKQFIWNQIDQTGQCDCPSPYVPATNGSCVCNVLISIPYGLGKCFDCTITYSTNSTLRKDRSSCDCISPYVFVWNSSTNIGKCVCPSGFMTMNDSTCFNCLITNSIGVSTDGLSCVCKSGFKFVWLINGTSAICDCISPKILNANKNLCICDPAISITLSNGNCFSCSILKNDAGTALNSKSCNCNTGFTFNSSATGGSCICDSKTSFVTANNGCFNCVIQNSLGKPIGQSCNCTSSFVWNWNSNAYTGTCDCPAPKSIVNKLCVCPSTSITLTAAPFCFDCLTLTNGAGQINSTNKSACVCNSPYVFVWNNSNQIGVCTCNSNSILLANGSCFSCVGIVNGTGKLDTNVKNCGCKSPFVWDSVKWLCVCNSNSIASKGSCLLCPTKNGTGVPSQTNSLNCGCNNNFVWNGSVCICKAPFNYITSSSTCSCSSPYKLSGSSCICSPDNAFLNSKNVCTLCSTILYSDSTTNSSSSCNCLSTFIWISGICGCDSSSALLFPNTIFAKCVTCNELIYAKSKNGTNKCTCLIASMVWNATKGACDCNTSSVILVSGNTYSCVTCNAAIYALAKVDSFSCSCSVGGMTWMTNQCCCNSTSILTADAACLSCGNSVALIDKYVCGCPSNNIWNDKLNTCVSCNTISGSTGTSLNGLVCGCTSGYWDVMQMTCVASIAGCTVSRPTAACMICSTIPFVTANSVAVAKTSAASRALFGGLAISNLLRVSGSNYQYLSGFMCKCKSGYSWQPNRYRCYKTTISIN